MGKRVAVGKKLRFEILKRDSFTCRYCGRSAPEVKLHVDHVIPVAEGGTSDPFNLVTACQDCNLGKKDRRIEDHQEIKKQLDQLREIQAQKNEVSDMIRWRKALAEGSEVPIFDHIAAACRPFELNDNGRKDVRKLIRKFGAEAVFDSIEIASDSYIKRDSEGRADSASVDTALAKLGGICHNNALPEGEKQLRWAINAFKKRGEYWNDRSGWAIIKEARVNGISAADIADTMRRSGSWSDWRYALDEMAEERATA